MTAPITSLGALESLAAEETGSAWIVLATISHTDLTTPLRYARNHADVTGPGSNVYTAMMFDLTLADQDGEKPAQARFRLDVVDQSILAALENLNRNEPPKVTIEVVLSDAPTVIVRSQLNLELRSYAVGIASLEGQLSAPGFANETSPGRMMTKDVMPGIFPDGS